MQRRPARERQRTACGPDGETRVSKLSASSAARHPLPARRMLRNAFSAQSGAFSEEHRRGKSDSSGPFGSRIQTCAMQS